MLCLMVAACGGDGGADPTLVPDPTNGPAATAPAATDPPAADTGGDPPIELGGTSWNVTDYSQGPGVITNVWKTDVTISFSADGTVSGSSGCNTYSAQWSVSSGYDPFEDGVPDENDGQAIEFADLAWTEIGCEDEDIMIQEQEILDLLQRAGRWVLIREAFHLRDSSGEYLFEAEPA